MRVGYLRCRTCAGTATYSVGEETLAGGHKADETWTHEGRSPTLAPRIVFSSKSGGLSVNSLSVNMLLQKLAICVTVFSLVFSSPAVAQVLPPAEKAARVEISQAPALELAHDDLTIIRWATNNPGGTDDHYGIVYYGTDLKELNQMAKSHVRLNRDHPETIFRVRIDGLKPRTTYYYKVTSMETNGKSDGAMSAVNQFTTPGPSERIVAYPPQPIPRPR
jgi:purple acid phosphatase-like protein